jgi:hypothetical protein
MRVMTLYKLRQQSVFGPEDISRMARAHARARRVLRLHRRDDPLTEIVAKKIIEAARSGERDPVRMEMLALRSIRHARH